MVNKHSDFKRFLNEKSLGKISRSLLTYRIKINVKIKLFLHGPGETIKRLRFAGFLDKRHRKFSAPAPAAFTSQ